MLHGLRMRMIRDALIMDSEIALYPENGILGFDSENDSAIEV